MEKERSNQQQFSIYSNKGGIVVKEELPSEKAFTKIVKEKDIAIDDEKSKLERNVTLNFDHSVVDGVLAIEQACAPKQINLSGPINQNQKQNQNQNQNQNLVSDQKVIKEKKSSDQGGIMAQLKENQMVSNDLSNLKLEEEIPLMDGTVGTSSESRTSNISLTGTNLHDLMKIENPNEESTDSIIGQGSPGTSNTSEKPASPSKERITTMQNNQEKKDFVNTGTNDSNNNNNNNNNNSPSVPSTPSSPVPNSGSLSNQSDSASTSTRSFAFPVLQRDWATSPAKLPKADKGRFGKCRGCSAIFCCKF